MKRNNKGFTLAELLIVVAIIGILVAISIPIFNKQIEKSREAYDIYTMRQAASLAVECYYNGGDYSTEPVAKVSATACGLKWWENNKDGIDAANAAGVYNPETGKFLPIQSTASTFVYGKGTKTDGGTNFKWDDNRTAYKPDLDYRNAVVMIAIYPAGNNKHIDVYWKYVKTGKNGETAGAYVGGQNGNNKNDPKYSIRIDLE